MTTHRSVLADVERRSGRKVRARSTPRAADAAMPMQQQVSPRAVQYMILIICGIVAVAFFVAMDMTFPGARVSDLPLAGEVAKAQQVKAQSAGAERLPDGCLLFTSGIPASVDISRMVFSFEPTMQRGAACPFDNSEGSAAQIEMIAKVRALARRVQ